MKKQTLRLLSFVLIFSMLVSYIQLPAIAQDGEQKSAYLISFVNEESAYDYVGNSAEAQLIAVTPPLVVADITSSQAESLSEEDFVESVEEDIFVHANTEEDIFVYANTGTVEDGDILHWNAEAVGAKSAHEAGFKGSGVKVAVLDSGVDLYSEVMVKDGIDFVDPENGDGDDMTGHGTAVTGIIAAPDDGEGVLGIAPQADIYSVRVLDDENKAPISRIIAGIDWCIEKKVDIINMSFGTSQYSALLEEKIEQAAEAGILMVSSAGNGDSVEYPAKFPEVIAVSSLTSSMILSDSSASGEEVEISAPGENIYTTSLIGGYGAFSGTSIAAPHVTAAAAVLLSKDTSKPTDFIRELLSASAKETSDTDSCGNGILDITYALDLYDDFAENYTQPEYIPTQNPAPVETFEEKDIYVTGSWSSAGHNGLADNYYDDAGRNIRFPLLIKEVSKKVDEKKGGNVAFHGNLNYVVTSKLLFEIARNYKTEGVSSFTHINYRSDLARFFQTAKVNYYYIMIEDITELLDDLDSESIAVSENDKKKGATDFVSVSEKTSTIVFGILFHLLGDIYAHRSIVPTMSVEKVTRTSHGGGINGNDGRYFVKKDFNTDCGTHKITFTKNIDNDFNAERERLEKEICSAKGFEKIVAVIKWLVFLIIGKKLITDKYKNLKIPDQAVKDRELLELAINVPKNANSKEICNKQLSCYGAMMRLAGMGVLQFKDIKYFLKDKEEEIDKTAIERYEANQRYYEDQAPGNVFYNRRYLAAKSVTKHYFEDFYASVRGGEIRDFLPYYLISQPYGNSISKYCVKIDQYYNYLLEFDPNSVVLKRSFWSDKDHSLFDFTTIVYDGEYFIDSSTYPALDGTPTYSGVFPRRNDGKTADSFYK